VTIKGFTDPGPFLDAVGRQLDELGVGGRPEIPTVPAGPRRGLPLRRVLKVRQSVIVGFAVIVSGLTDAESLRLQECGLGGRRHMGCGIFSPLPQETTRHHAL
jgi:CRISPR-associated endonuclease/helicase Cas3